MLGSLCAGELAPALAVTFVRDLLNCAKLVSEIGPARAERLVRCGCLRLQRLAQLAC